MQYASALPTSARVSARTSIQLLLLTLTSAAAFYARTALSPLQETIRIALSLSDNQMALLQGPALALPLVLGAVPLGLLIDRYSRVRLLLLLASLDVLGSLLTAWASHFLILFVARALIGLAATTTCTAAFSLLADLCPAEQRGRANMMVLIGQFAGLAAAFALGGVLAVNTGGTPTGWRWALLWMTLPLIPLALLIFAMREPARTGVAIENPSPREAFAELWRYRNIIAPLLLGLVTTEIASGAVLVWAAPSLSRGFGLSADRIGAILSSVVLVSGVLGCVAGGILADACHRTGGPTRTATALSVLALLNLLADLFPIAPSPAWASVLLFLFMTIVGALLVTGIALFTIVIPNELRGLCLSAMTGINTLFAVAFAPLTVSLLSGTLGGPAMIGRALTLVCVAASLLGGVTFAWGRRSIASAPLLQATLTAGQGIP